MKVIICERRIKERKETERLLLEYAARKVIGISIEDFMSVSECIDSGCSADVIFVSDCSGAGSCIDSCRELRDCGCGAPVIIISSDPSAMQDAFEVDAFRFRLYPICVYELFSDLDEIYAGLVSGGKGLLLESRYSAVHIPYDEIVYLSGSTYGTKIRTKRGCHDSPGPLIGFEHKLPCDMFVRCHRAFIVNLSHVTCISREQLITDTDEIIPVSRRMAASFGKRYKYHIIRRDGQSEHIF